jgi:hypothetical protein
MPQRQRHQVKCQPVADHHQNGGTEAGELLACLQGRGSDRLCIRLSG